MQPHYNYTLKQIIENTIILHIIINCIVVAPCPPYGKDQPEANLLASLDANSVKTTQPLSPLRSSNYKSILSKYQMQLVMGLVNSRRSNNKKSSLCSDFAKNGAKRELFLLFIKLSQSKWAPSQATQTYLRKCFYIFTQMLL